VLVADSGKLALRLQAGAHRSLEGMRSRLRGAGRGLPRRHDLLALPRQRFDGAERRLGRALLANTRAHAVQLARCGSRLQLRLLQARLMRAHDRLEGLGRRASTSLLGRVGPRRARLERIAGRLSLESLNQRLCRCAERLAVMGARAQQAARMRLVANRRALDGCTNLLRSLSYQGVLQRGYALVRDLEGRPVRSVAQVTAGRLLDIELADGHVGAQALEGEKPRDKPPARAPGASPRSKPGGSGQGSLF
jgi:exodeoxyribonuclease VII large subunit